MVIRPVTVLAAIGCIVALFTPLQADDAVELSVGDRMTLAPGPKASNRPSLRRTPAMIGDFYAGSPLRFQADRNLGSLLVIANDLDAPLVLPPGGSVLSISEPGPMGIFQSSLSSVQQYQALLRSSSPLPPFVLAGLVNQDATLTTRLSVNQTQALLASTGQAYDVIPVQAPPSTYNSDVQVAFVALHGSGGQTMFNAANSGALLQGGVDTLSGGVDLDALYFFDYVVRFDTALADAASGGVGRTKIAEGGTILPQDRFFMRYNYIDAVRYADGRGIGLNRFTPGFERALLDGLASFELRAPLAAGTTTTSTYDGVSGFSNDRDVRFGNLSLYGKLLLVERETVAISGGMGVALPTAQDLRVQNLNGSPMLEIANQSVRLQPFLGALYAPSERWYAHGFAQFDAAASGNLVSIDATGQGMRNVGTYTDANMLYLDAGLGYWLYRDNSAQPSRGTLTGIIPTVEVHHTLAAQTGDVVHAGAYQIGNFSGTPNFTNLVAGSTFEFGHRSQLVLAYGTPLDNSLRQYDGALTVSFTQLTR